MLIGEFARRTGLTPDTIRFYEKLGFFSRRRRGNGYRVYDEDDVETANLIESGKSMGFSLREIQAFLLELSRGSIDHPGVQRSLRQRLALIDERIASLQRSRALVEEQLQHCRQAELAERLLTPDQCGCCDSREARAVRTEARPPERPAGLGVPASRTASPAASRISQGAGPAASRPVPR